MHHLYGHMYAYAHQLQRCRAKLPTWHASAMTTKGCRVLKAGYNTLVQVQELIITSFDCVLQT